jgi:hypothetical protein
VQYAYKFLPFVSLAGDNKADDGTNPIVVSVANFGPFR